MLEYLQPLPHVFYASGSHLGAERDRNVIVVIERAELLPLVCGVAGHVYQQCPGVLSQQGLGFLSPGVNLYHGSIRMEGLHLVLLVLNASRKVIKP